MGLKKINGSGSQLNYRLEKDELFYLNINITSGYIISANDAEIHSHNVDLDIKACGPSAHHYLILLNRIDMRVGCGDPIPNEAPLLLQVVKGEVIVGELRIY